MLLPLLLRASQFLPSDFTIGSVSQKNNSLRTVSFSVSYTLPVAETMLLKLALLATAAAATAVKLCIHEYMYMCVLEMGRSSVTTAKYSASVE